MFKQCTKATNCLKRQRHVAKLFQPVISKDMWTNVRTVRGQNPTNLIAQNPKNLPYTSNPGTENIESWYAQCLTAPNRWIQTKSCAIWSCSTILVWKRPKESEGARAMNAVNLAILLLNALTMIIGMFVLAVDRVVIMQGTAQLQTPSSQIGEGGHLKHKSRQQVKKRQR